MAGKRAPRRFKRRGRAKTKRKTRPKARLPLVLPIRFMNRMNFTSEFEGVTPLANLGYFQDFRLGSIIDADANDPNDRRNAALGYSLLFYAYQHWHVVSSTIMVEFHLKKDQNDPVLVGIRRTSLANQIAGDGVNAGTVAQDFESSRYSQARVMNQEKRQTRFRLSYSAKKIFGGSLLANSELQGGSALAASAIPNENTFCQIFVIGTDPTTTPEVEFRVKIQYVVVWTEPKVLGLQSTPIEPPLNDN